MSVLRVLLYENAASECEELVRRMRRATDARGRFATEHNTIVITNK